MCISCRWNGRSYQIKDRPVAMGEKIMPKGIGYGKKKKKKGKKKKKSLTQ